MKKISYIIFLCLLTVFILISGYAFTEELTDVVTKVALMYEGESSYRIYDISNANMTYDPDSNTAEYGPGAIVTLTDESNNLPSGIITKIKYYVVVQDGTGWIPDPFNGDLLEAPDNALNFLGSNIDLSTVKRKRVTTRFYGGQGAGNNDIAVASPTEQNL